MSSAPGTPYPIEIVPPAIGRWRQGNTGIDYVHSFEAATPGPHVMITALVHGNEVCGAVVVDRLLAHGLRPDAGRLSFGFTNFEAYQRIDFDRPDASRYVEEDFNRLWSPEVLESDRRSLEVERARELRPYIDTVDLLLDIHSMQHPCQPLLLAGPAAKGLDLARRVGFPSIVVADSGHRAGRRLRDYAAFSDPKDRKNALLVECGQHYAAASCAVALETALRFLAAAGSIGSNRLAEFGFAVAAPPQRVIEVTQAVTIESETFRFTRDFKGLEIIPRAGTALAEDGGQLVRTPYEDCVLIMPTRRFRRGNTAVRLGRYVA